MPNSERVHHPARATGTGIPSSRADNATRSAVNNMLNGWRRTAARASVRVISRLLSVQAQRIDLDEGDSLLAEPDRDRRLSNRQARELVRTDEERLAPAQQPTRDGSGRSELDLPND